MKKNILITLLSVLALLFGLLAFLPGATDGVVSKEDSVKKTYLPRKLSLIRDITCTFPQVLNASYSEKTITHILPKPESTPLITTFSDFKGEKLKIKFLDATNTISETGGIKLIDTSEKFMFVEGTGEPYLTIYTIYKDSGASTYTKQVSIFGIPSATAAIGTCIDS